MIAKEITRKQETALQKNLCTFFRRHSCLNIMKQICSQFRRRDRIGCQIMLPSQKINKIYRGHMECMKAIKTFFIIGSWEFAFRYYLDSVDSKTKKSTQGSRFVLIFRVPIWSWGTLCVCKHFTKM